MAQSDPEVGGGDSTRPDEPTSRSAQAGRAFGRWRAGETRAMDDLVRVMTPVLWHVVRAYGLDRTVAEDVVQTTWLTLVRRHASIASTAAVAAWLTMCARREAWRVLSALRREQPEDADTIELRLPEAEAVDDTAERAERDRRLWSALEHLDARCRRLLRVIAFEDRPDYSGLARDLAMPVGSIGPTRQRCLGKLRTRLDEDGGGRDGDGR